MGLTAAPDGIDASASARYTSSGTPSVVMLDVRTGEETAATAPTGCQSTRGRCVLAGWDARGLRPHLPLTVPYQLVVAPADGSERRHRAWSHAPRGGPAEELDVNIAYTPDGTAVMAGHRHRTDRRRRSGASRSTARQGPSLRRAAALPSRTPSASPRSHRSAGPLDRSGGPAAAGTPGYNRVMAHRVTLIPGDGIGPELAEATRRVLDATGIAFEWESVEAGEAAIAEHGTPLPDDVLESIKRNKVALKGPITTPGRRGLPERQRHPAPGARAVRQPAAGALDQGPRDALRGRRPRHRPREHRGPLRRHRAHGRPRRRREHQDHHPRGVRADRPVRLRVRRRQRPPQGHGRPQGQHHEAVRRAVPRELPDGRRRLRRPDRVRGPHRRQHVHAARPEAGPVRRPGAAEPVRRHRERPRGRAGRRPGRRARAPTSAPRPRSSSRSTARRPSTPGWTRRTRPR